MPAALRFHFPWNLLKLLPLMLVPALAGCGGSGGAVLDHADKLFNTGLPALSELRSTQAAGDHTVLASAFDAISQGVVKEGNFPLEVLRMDASDGGGFEWAVFSFDAAATGEELLNVAVTMASEDGSIDPAFAAVSDFSNGRWRVVGPFSSATAPADFTFELNSATDLSPEGRVFVAVISPVGSELLVGLLNFRTLALQNPAADIQADLTSGEAPLTVNFDASASADSDGEIVLYEWDVAGDGNFEASTGLSPAHQISYSNGGIFSATVRVTDNDGLSSTAAIEVTVTEGGNIPPQAVLESDVLDGEAEPGFSVNFSADQSSDSDGSITLYEWDLDSDTSTGSGGFEVSSPTPDDQQVAYSQAGEFIVRLRVTDNGGLKRVDTLRIVSHGWVQVPVTTLTDGGQAGSFDLTVIGKGPAFCYDDEAANRVYFARSASEFGTDAADWTLTELNVTSLALPMSLAMVAGKPAIAFTSGSGGDLIFARSETSSGAAPGDWTPFKINASSSSGASLAIVDGRPAVSCIDTDSNELLYIHSGTPEGMDFNDWTTVKVDDLTVDSFDTSLALVNGNPAVVWYDNNGSGASTNYARSQSADGGDSADWQQLEVVNQGSFETNARLDLLVTAGRPAIAFAAPVSSPSYAFSSSATGQSATDWDSLSLQNNIGSLSQSLALVNGLPVVLFEVRDSNARHRLARSSTPEGSSLVDWAFEDVTQDETITLNAIDSSLAEVGGFPAVVFFDSAADQIVYAVRF